MTRSTVWSAAWLLVLGCGTAASPAPAPVASGGAAPPIVISSGHEPPPGAPYSQQEHHEHLGLLQANGFSDQRSTWPAAAQHGEATIRAAALALLAEAPRPDDRSTLAAGARDASPLARAWAALGLVRLGDRARLDELRALATPGAERQDPTVIVAAGLLARLGDRAGVPVLRAAMADPDTRLQAARWLSDAAHADADAAWLLFSSALADPSPTLRSLALAQLEELRDPRSRPVLERAAAGSMDEAEKARVQALLAALP